MKILITGSASGLGKAFALKFADAGYEVCVSDVNDEHGQEVADLINSNGGSAFYQRCDITQQWDVEKLALKLAEKMANSGYLNK